MISILISKTAIQFRKSPSVGEAEREFSSSKTDTEERFSFTFGTSRRGEGIAILTTDHPVLPHVFVHLLEIRSRDLITPMIRFSVFTSPFTGDCWLESSKLICVFSGEKEILEFTFLRSLFF